jgi:hypothetical protein
MARGKLARNFFDNVLHRMVCKMTWPCLLSLQLATPKLETTNSSWTPHFPKTVAVPDETSVLADSTNTPSRQAGPSLTYGAHMLSTLFDAPE